jgi:hypothetical protein
MGSVFQAILTSVPPEILAKAVGDDDSREDSEGDIFEAIVAEMDPLYAAIDDPRYINPDFIHDLTFDDESFPHPVVFGATKPRDFEFWLRKWTEAQFEEAMQALERVMFSEVRWRTEEEMGLAPAAVVIKRPGGQPYDNRGTQMIFSGFPKEHPRLSVEGLTRIWDDKERILRWPDGVQYLGTDIVEDEDDDVRTATGLAEGAYLWSSAFFSLIHRSSKLTSSEMSGVLSNCGKHALVLVQQHT